MAETPEVTQTSKPQEQKVSWFELFYDLVVVAAVALIGKVFIKSPDGKTTALVVTALLVLFAVWLLTTLSHGFFPQDDPLRRLALLAQMILLSISALSLGKYGLPNWIGFLAASGAMLALATVFYRHLRSPGSAGVIVRLILRVLLLSALGFALSAVVSIWLNSAQTAVVTPVILLVSSAILLVPVITTLARLLASGSGLDEHYLQERFGLFVIIVLGESLIGLVGALAGKGTIPNPMYFVITFVVAFSVWSIYFNAIMPYGVPSSANRLRAWLASHVLLVLSIVVMAVEFADLTLNDAEVNPDVPSQTWSALPVVFVALSVTLITLTLRTPREIRIINLATLAVLLIVEILESRVIEADSNWFIFIGALVLTADAAACSVVVHRARRPVSVAAGA